MDSGYRLDNSSEGGVTLVRTGAKFRLSWSPSSKKAVVIETCNKPTLALVAWENHALLVEDTVSHELAASWYVKPGVLGGRLGAISVSFQSAEHPDKYLCRQGLRLVLEKPTSSRLLALSSFFVFHDVPTGSSSVLLEKMANEKQLETKENMDITKRDLGTTEKEEQNATGYKEEEEHEKVQGVQGKREEGYREEIRKR
eukprot:TRINITY_DN7108_c0_g1_i3.p3 TRINITY_DN7108_c0_g1~~TRINITY_DN7108_c0_g1_i3.p3  ORF type:complete len:199 (+),score=51.00 TRINITY_DN7108_c0_g1_i3:1063-1659(+)